MSSEVFYQPYIGTSAYICQSCGGWVTGVHTCNPALSVAPMDPRLVPALERIASALEAIVAEQRKVRK